MPANEKHRSYTYVTYTHCDTRITRTDEHNVESNTVLDINENRALRTALAVLGAAFTNHNMMTSDDWRSTRFHILQAFYRSSESDK